MNICELVLDEAFCHIALVSQHGGVMFLNFVLQSIIFLYCDNDSEGDQHLDCMLDLCSFVLVDSLKLVLQCHNT